MIKELVLGQPNGPSILSLWEMPRPLVPGDKIGVDGKDEVVYEVRRLQAMQQLAGAPRRLFVALHAGSGSVRVFVVLNGEQREWVKR